MKGRIIAWLIIGFIGVPLLLFFGTALILFLAPGVSIFGVRYVANGVVNFTDSKVVSLSEFSGDVNVNSLDVPVTVEYAGMTDVQVIFKQEYIGFTRTEATQPSLNVSLDKDGNLNISTVEIQKFIFASKLYDSYYLVVRLPSANRNLNIKAETSNVEIKGSVGNAPKIDVLTEGKFSVQNKMTIENLILNTDSDVELNSNLTLSNATIVTGNHYINIKCAATGNLDLTTKSGKISFNECNNLKVNTSSGSIGSSVDSGSVVKGKVDITTRSGGVNISKILGVEEASTITTKTGELNIDYVNDIVITSTRGIVNVGQSRNITVNGGSGDVTIGGVLGQAVIKAKNGKVILGSEDGNTIANPTVNTTTGKIFAYNTYGTVSLISENNAVYLKNTQGSGATKFKLSAGKTLTAKNLEGEVSAYANGEVNLHFQKLNKNVTVDVGAKCKVVTIDAKCKLYDEVNYLIKSSKNKKATVYADDEVVVTDNPINNTSLVAAPTITVSGAYQVTTLYLAKV